MVDADVAPEGPRRVHVHGGSLYILYAKCILQCPLGASSGSFIAKHRRVLRDFVIDADGARYFLDSHGIIKVSRGDLAVLDNERLKTHGARLLDVGRDQAMYFVEAGRRVMRFAGGETSAVAGGLEKGASPAQLDGVGGLVVARDGTLYISDVGNNRIQKWSAGAVVGTTVAGGNGAGNRCDQLDRPAGLFVAEDDTIYVADSTNQRIMKWREGWLSGMVVAGGAR